jgi:hypothetical protein
MATSFNKGDPDGVIKFIQRKRLAKEGDLRLFEQADKVYYSRTAGHQYHWKRRVPLPKPIQETITR